MGTTPRTASVSRRVRSVGGRMLRRFGMLPGGMPDGLGEDDRLLGSRLPHRVMVYFADPQESLYQLEQWYGPLRALNEVHPVVVVCMDSRTAARVRNQSGLDVITIARDATLDDLLSRSDVKLCLYANHNPQNFSALRFRSLVHVSMLHGDSDKSVSVSNQVKGYDYTFVAGQAAVDRFAAYTTLFDAATRCIPVGRPQLDTDTPVLDNSPAGASASDRRTVLYAPTWEGGQDSVAYGSVDTHGVVLVERLIEAGFRLIYRPHPLSGVRVAGYGEADANVRSLVEKAAAAEPGVGHHVSVGGPLTEAFTGADLLISDVSAVANDWLPTMKPLVITAPAAGRARAAATRLLDVAPRLTVAQVSDVATVVQEQLDEDPRRDERAQLVRYYLGDVTPGASLGRFLSACEKLMEVRDAEWGRVLRHEMSTEPLVTDNKVR